eukprot:CAMPEP_0197842716 /NCGR_PEP_ID=MMETSP1437-20131217/46902_1 /TAXON_ID=49252 ORGANISM="Eucampia antarctica, Strain CCMP1452" /NCGR_SAMPLE_ID=MMETSP1437 /ASSEMBLY_ACC=CAM_ASM_001096 /LENGTH=293 /DNA_ID=CAMNT_0043452637 /DNA_START=33 /DNA_END=914 /DNA_ORIENTATION=+
MWKGKTVTHLLTSILMFGVDAQLEYEYDSSWDMYYVSYEGKSFYEEHEHGLLIQYDEDENAQEILVDNNFSTWSYNLDCDYESQRPLYDDAAWGLYKTRYHEVTGHIPRDDLLNGGDRTSGFNVPIEVQHIEGKGRAVIATSFIRKGELIYSGLVNPAEFFSIESFWQYIISIPRELACDALQWVYKQDLGDYDGGTQCTPVICFEMDEGALFNNGDSDSDVNVGCHPMFGDMYPQLCQKQYFSLKDIYPGEELLLDYGYFVSSQAEMLFPPTILGVQNSTKQADSIMHHLIQ